MRFFYLLSILTCAAWLACGQEPAPTASGPAAVVEDSGVPRAKTRAEADARAALAERGISFTGASFVEWAGTGDLSVVELFVEGGMPIDASFGGWTALHEAARNGHLAVVQYLIDQGASLWAVTESGSTALGLALQGGHTDLVENLPLAPREKLAALGIAYRVDAFLDAALDGRLAVVRLFVQAGMPVNAGPDRTALHFAAGEGHLEVVEFLVGAGADVNATDTIGKTALHFAAWRGRLEVVEFLVGAGADVDATDTTGDTPRGEAVYCSTATIWFLTDETKANCAAVVEYLDSLDDDE